MPRTASLSLGLALGLIVGCTPVLDWREVRSGEKLQALFPCRPQVQSRRVVVAGQTVTMELSSCSAGDANFAISRIDTGSPTQVTPILQAMLHLLATNLSAPAAAVSKQPAASPLAGATPNPLAQRVKVVGTGPDGDPIQAEGQFVVVGGLVFQASVVGRRTDPEAVDFFLSSLKVLP